MYTLIEDIGRDSFVSFHLIQYLKNVICICVKCGCEKFNVFNHFARRQKASFIQKHSLVDTSKKDVLEPLFTESLIDGIGECKL